MFEEYSDLDEALESAVLRSPRLEASLAPERTASSILLVSVYALAAGVCPVGAEAEVDGVAHDVDATVDSSGLPVAKNLEALDHRRRLRVSLVPEVALREDSTLLVCDEA